MLTFAILGLTVGASDTIIGGLVVAFGWWMLQQILSAQETKRRIAMAEKRLADIEGDQKNLVANWGKMLERVDERTRNMERDQAAMRDELKSLRDEVKKEVLELKCDVSVLKSKMVEEA